MSSLLCLLHALGVCLGEAGLALKCSDCDGELRHWVEVVGAAVNELLDELWEIGSGGPLGGEVADLLLAGHFAGQEEPEETLWQRLGATWRLREKLLAFWDLVWSVQAGAEGCAEAYSLAAEADTLLRIQD